jgi:hypothetical protein
MPTLAERFQQGRREGRQNVESGRTGDIVKSMSTVWGFYVLSVLIVLAGVGYALSSTQAGHGTLGRMQDNLQQGVENVKDWAREKVAMAHDKVNLADAKLRKQEADVKADLLETKYEAAELGDQMRAGATQVANEMEYLVDKSYWQARYQQEHAGLTVREVELMAERKVQELKDDAIARAREAEYAVKHGLNNLRNYVGAKAGEVKTAFQETGHKIGEKVHGAEEFVADRIDDAASKAHGAAEELRRQGERV